MHDYFTNCHVSLDVYAHYFYAVDVLAVTRRSKMGRQNYMPAWAYARGRLGGFAPTPVKVPQIGTEIT